MKTNTLTARERTARILALMVLSPVIAEVLFGSTSLSMIYLLLPQICIYGGAAMIIHTLARRRGWTAILLLGVAFAIAEECIILQTSVSPPYQHLLFGSAPNQNYLGALGINGAYLLWALGYESIWAILLPVLLVELIFPSGNMGPWIGRRGLVLCSLVFLVPSYGIWHTFTQKGIAPGLAYEAPPILILAASGIILLLGAGALAHPGRRTPERKTPHPVPLPWQVGMITFLLGLPWFALAVLPYLVPASIPSAVCIMIGVIWAAASFLLFRYWGSSLKWQEPHRLAVVFGALLSSMLAGFIINGPILSPLDLFGKAVLDLCALLLLALLALNIRHRHAGATQPQMNHTEPSS
jgi:hypothetical protein